MRFELLGPSWPLWVRRLAVALTFSFILTRAIFQGRDVSITLHPLKDPRQ